MAAIAELRAAVVGTGFIGAVHIDALRRLGVHIEGVVGSTEKRAQASARRLNIDRAYASYDEMLADPRVDVVHITSPNSEHYEQAKAALAAGKHLVCEKPLAMDSTQTAELARLASESGLIAAVNFNIRFYSLIHEMRARILTGETGRPFLVTGSYFQDWLLRDTDWNWRLEPERVGALRVVGDVGSHWFDLAAFVTGQRIESVLAELTTVLPIRRKPFGQVETFADSADVAETEEYRVTSEDLACVLVRFEGGARGVVALSQVSSGHKNSIKIEVNASENSLAWAGERPDELWVGHRDEPNELMLRDPAYLSKSARSISRLPGGHAEGFENSFRAMYEAVYGDIVQGSRSADSLYATFADGHVESLVLDAVAQSGQTGTWATVPPYEESIQ